ncbi:type VII secretion target [Nocardia sp. NPDC049526]|uniref:type VII secretion target n=1 Tax=Nocardia sp. NPDC049526 TaxID=3364316 RepID=UPI00378E1DEE
MPERLVVEPDELRRIAAQHQVAAAKLREWGVIPHAWLDEFPDTYGSIADPMHGALVDYYNKRHDRAERLAITHEQTRDQLLAAAQALEDHDEAGGHQITQAGGRDHGAPSGGHNHGAPTAQPVHTGPDAPMDNSTQPAQPPVTAPPNSVGPDGTARYGQAPHEQAPQSPPASSPQTYANLPTGAETPIAAAAPSVGASEYSPPDMPVTPVDNSSGATGTVGGPSLVGGMPAGLAADSYPAAVTSGAGSAARSAGPLVAGPFAAAVHTAAHRRALPSLVVGERVEDDLVLARTLLAAIRHAVDDSVAGLEWAVAVVRTHAGPMVFLTSTEGRGWLPPGLFLPSEVILPWRWDSLLGDNGREAVAALEGTTDPARIIAEFGSIMARRRRFRLSALASSTAVPEGVRASVGDDGAIGEWVSAAESAVDLTEPGVGLVDRLALAGSDELLRQTAAVPDAEIRAKCLELARVADAQVRAAVPGLDGESGTRRALRRRILDALHAGQSVPASWWDQLRAADDVAAAALQSWRVDVSYIPVGGLRPGASGTRAARDMVFERRADELLLLLAAGEHDRQTLRDAFYVYGQIVEHPQFPATAHAEATPGLKTVDAGIAVRDGWVARSAEPGAAGVGAISVSSTVLGGPPPSVDELLKRPAVSEGSGEQRRA